MFTEQFHAKTQKSKEAKLANIPLTRGIFYNFASLHIPLTPVASFITLLLCVKRIRSCSNRLLFVFGSLPKV